MCFLLSSHIGIKLFLRCLHVCCSFTLLFLCRMQFLCELLLPVWHLASSTPMGITIGLARVSLTLFQAGIAWVSSSCLGSLLQLLLGFLVCQVLFRDFLFCILLVHLRSHLSFRFQCFLLSMSLRQNFTPLCVLRSLFLQFVFPC